jgi:hypothetical protein
VQDPLAGDAGEPFEPDIEPLPFLEGGVHTVTIVAVRRSRHKNTIGEWQDTLDRAGRQLFAFHFANEHGRARAFYAVTSHWRPADDGAWALSKWGAFLEAAFGPCPSKKTEPRDLLGRLVRIAVAGKNGKAIVVKVLAP